MYEAQVLCHLCLLSFDAIPSDSQQDKFLCQTNKCKQMPCLTQLLSPTTQMQHFKMLIQAVLHAYLWLSHSSTTPESHVMVVGIRETKSQSKLKTEALVSQ
mgnify:CR=1 FL=1